MNRRRLGVGGSERGVKGNGVRLGHRAINAPAQTRYYTGSSQKWEQYNNLSGISGIDEFSIAEHWIDVKFRNSNKIYRYSDTLNSTDTIERMKQTADSGYLLNRFINQHKPNFEVIAGG